MKTSMRVLTTDHRPWHQVQRSGTTALELALLSPACLVALYAIVSSGYVLAEQHAAARSEPAAQPPATARAPLLPQAETRAPSASAMTAGRLDTAAPALQAGTALAL